MSLLSTVALLSLVGQVPSPAPPSIEVKVAPAEKTSRGVLVHEVTSPYQAGRTAIHVLLPDRIDPDRRLAVLYVLPVEAGEGKRWGDALAEVLQHDLHNRHQLICVYPTFSHLPWYADHPHDVQIRQETYLLTAVLPFVEKTYPARAGRSGRLLVGFSKSGWGAFSLLLRHPDVFSRAAAWDAPLMQARPDRFGMGPIFGTPENFAHYQITKLLRCRADDFRGEPRLIHLGYDNFRDHHLSLEALLREERIAHIFRDGPHRRHAWESGWLPEAVELLTAEDLKGSSKTDRRGSSSRAGGASNS